MPQILLLAANVHGEDFIVGDPHGSFDQFEAVVNSLKSDDRLFVVGDLTDKGVASEKLLDLVINTNSRRTQQGLAQQIYVARGNHEHILQNHLETLLHPETCSENINKINIAEHLANGGGWLQSVAHEKLTGYLDYLRTLPFYILVTDKQPFIVVHAGRRRSWPELLKLAQSKDDNVLPIEEQIYCMWARPNGSKNSHVDLIEDELNICHEALTYCGHNPLGGLRPRQLHINLDFYTYKTGVLGVANHSKFKLDLIKIPVQNAAKILATLQLKINVIDEYFRRVEAFEAVFALVRRIEDMQEWYALLQRKKHLPDLDDLKKCATEIESKIDEKTPSNVMMGIFRDVVILLENAYETALKSWRNGLFSKKPAVGFTSFLNADLNSYWPSHHYKRMLSITLADVAREFPEDVTKKYIALTADIKNPGIYRFTSMLTQKENPAPASTASTALTR